jgi:6,7-dimethyl-8-ribityllumazine synthase
MSTGSPPEVEVDGRGLRFAICATRWNTAIVEQLLEGAQETLRDKGAANVRVYRCTGAFELGPLVARVARKGGIDGIVALCCLIRGGTDHYTLLSHGVTRALGAVALEGGTNPRPLAVSYGVLTCDTLAQAQERAAVKGADKGGEAALTCIEQVRALQAVDE